jgi:hypothetical protein
LLPSEPEPDDSRLGPLELVSRLGPLEPLSTLGSLESGCATVWPLVLSCEPGPELSVEAG